MHVHARNEVRLDLEFQIGLQIDYSKHGKVARGSVVLKTRDLKKRQKSIQDCISPDYMGNYIIKVFLKNSHFENMRDGFLQRCQYLFRYFTPEMMHFQAWKRKTNNNLIHLQFRQTISNSESQFCERYLSWFITYL